jgi:U3 small nucleolar RNA-associated protein 23
VPLVYINRSVMVMEPMAGRSAEVREAEEKGKVRAGLKSRRGAEVSGEKRKADDGEEAKEADLDASVPKRKKPKGPSGPNPLSVKKAKKPVDEQKKSQGRKVEDERSVLRRAAKQDPQAGEKALSAEAALGEGGASADAAAAAEGTSGGKRTRKRKPKEAPSAPSDEAVAAAVRTAISDARYDVD